MTRDELCWSIGPRIGESGYPYCLQPWWHKGLHCSHPDSGFDEEWGAPLCRAGDRERAHAWLPDELMAVMT